MSFVPGRRGGGSESSSSSSRSNTHPVPGKRTLTESLPVQRKVGVQDATGWGRVDDRKFGYYGYNNDGTTAGNTSPGSSPSPLKPATLYDKPSWNHPNTRWDFEAAVTAKAGADAGTIYGALSWGFDVDKDNKVTSHAPKHLDKQSGSFDKAVAKWNEQAKGDESKRNHEDQVELGPFKSKK